MKSPVPAAVWPAWVAGWLNLRLRRQVDTFDPITANESGELFLPYGLTLDMVADVPDVLTEADPISGAFIAGVTAFDDGSYLAQYAATGVDGCVLVASTFWHRGETPVDIFCHFDLPTDPTIGETR